MIFRPQRSKLEFFLSPVAVFLENYHESQEIEQQQTSINSTYNRVREYITPRRILGIKNMKPQRRDRVLEDLFLERGYMRFAIECDKEQYLSNFETNPECISRVNALKFFDETVIPTYEREFGSLEQYRQRRAA